MEYNIAFGKSRLDKKWQNKTITWEQFIDKINHTHRTVETVDEYINFKKGRQDEIKDVGGFVGGYLASGRRLANAITTRSILTFDADEAEIDFWEKFCLHYSCSAAIYSTHKHTPEAPRFRLIIPLEREVYIDEYAAIVRRIAGNMGINMFDHTGYQPHRLMYWPSTSKDGVFVFKEQKGKLLSPDEILNTYINWKDVSEWPISEREQKNLKGIAKKQGEPSEKPGLIGAFCRAYTIETVIDTFLSDVYEKSDIDNRYTFKEGSTAAGAVVYDNTFIFSHHSTDPTCEKLCNAFDLVRLHKFYLLDNLNDDLPINKQPSFVAMCDLVSNDILVKQQIGEHRINSSKIAFEDVKVVTDDLDWLKKMDIDRKGNYLTTINNVALILEYDSIFKNNIAFDEFKQQAIFKKDLPWRKIKKRNLLNDNDLANIENYIEKVYKFQVGAKLGKGLLIVLEKHSFHPIVEYLKMLKWDGVKRVDELMIKYLGAKDDEYTRIVTRKSLCACVARVMEPGIKFDYVLTLIGDEGQGKSQLFDRIGMGWFSDTFNLHMLKGKEAYEQIQGVWIIEIGELSGMAKAEIERVKGFIAARKDMYRSPYARTTEERLRQNIFFATSNELTPLRSQTGNRRFWPVATFETKPRESVYNLSLEEIGQIWAEVVYLYSKGETLYLDKRMTKIAKNIQEDFTEENPLIEMIKEYLKYKIPENWYSLDKWAKKEFINNYDENEEGLKERNIISKYEIWEMIMDKKDPIDSYGIKMIKQAMGKIDSFIRTDEMTRFGNSYPRSKGNYARKVVLESIL